MLFIGIFTPGINLLCFNLLSSTMKSISFEMPNPKNVKLTIFDMRGRNIRQMNLGILNNGLHKVLWDGKNNLGIEIPSGIYMAVLEVGDEFNIQKISLVK